MFNNSCARAHSLLCHDINLFYFLAVIAGRVTFSAIFETISQAMARSPPSFGASKVKVLVSPLPNGHKHRKEHLLIGTSPTDTYLDRNTSDNERSLKDDIAAHVYHSLD